MTNVDKALVNEVLNELEEVSKMKLGSEEHVKTVQATNGLIDRINESDKIKNEERRLDIEERKLDIEDERLRADKKDRLIRHVMTGVTFAVSVGVTIWANIDSKHFEEGYTHTTEAGRGSTRKLLSLLDKFKI